MDVDQLGILAHQVIVDRRDCDAAARQLRENWTQLRAREHEIAHEHGVLGVVAESCPSAEGEFRCHRHVLQMKRDVTPRQVEAVVTPREHVGRLENARDRIPHRAPGLVALGRAQRGRPGENRDHEQRHCPPNSVHAPLLEPHQARRRNDWYRLSKIGPPWAIRSSSPVLAIASPTIMRPTPAVSSRP